ncbi:MAG: acylneuraminate cytidylyltransferase family protein [Planctomycetota bacterium]|jgi:N-acylneuraminate cytidylyltransferase/CMP-N,N'-diacetyllegionaminic acid synthase
MHRGKTVLCIIPARGGSKRLKDKNIMPVCGRPLIYWAIKAAGDSGICDEIMVSTDSRKITRIAIQCGAKVQRRPKELATDTSLVRDTMMYALKQLDQKYDYVLLLEPTSPLTTGIDILRAANVLRNKKGQMVISVCKSTTPMGISRPLPESHSLKGFLPKELRTKRTQEIPQTYQLNGAIYLAEWDIFAEGKDYYEQDVYAYICPEDGFVDIHDKTDLVIAESLLRQKHARKSFFSNLSRLL